MLPLKDITIEVLHSPNIMDPRERNGFTFNFPPKHVATLTFDAIEPGPENEDPLACDYMEVECHNNAILYYLEEAYHDSNNIEINWIENDSVVWASVDQSRSSSPGDMFLLRATPTRMEHTYSGNDLQRPREHIIGLFRVEGVGFSNVTTHHEHIHTCGHYDANEHEIRFRYPDGVPVVDAQGNYESRWVKRGNS